MQSADLVIPTALVEQAEALRVNKPGAKAFPATDMSLRILANCTYQQLAHDLEYLQQLAQQANEV